jgi:hypothetical protein
LAWMIGSAEQLRLVTAQGISQSQPILLRAA